MQINHLKERSPFVLFLPFLLIYILYVICFYTDQREGDELRYIQFAQNLLNGFYSPAYPNIDLINGPGYPILLMPFVALKLPLISISLFNAVLHYLSVVFLFKSINLSTTSFKTSIIIALCWGFNILAYQEMPLILTETFTLFLISVFSYQIVKIYTKSDFSKRSLLIAGLSLGFLILTKVIFAYVLVLFILIAGLAHLIYKQKSRLMPFIYILGISFITIIPYITYTYSLTGKFFYLSSEGGKVLYWMTSLDPHEYGDWNNNTFTANCSETFCNSDYFIKNHGADMKRIGQCKDVLEVDATFKAIAIKNLKTNPLKYVRNWFSNIGRLLFGFPASYYFQSPTTLVRIYINSILLLAMVYGFIISLWNWKTLPLEIKILLIFSISYLSLSSLVSAYPRQFNVMIPAILIWTTYAVKRSIKINLKITAND